MNPGLSLGSAGGKSARSASPLSPVLSPGGIFCTQWLNEARYMNLIRKVGSTSNHRRPRGGKGRGELQPPPCHIAAAEGTNYGEDETDEAYRR